MKKFTVEVTVPEGLQAGDKFNLEVVAPETTKKKGQLAGLTLADMSDEQLKREIINAGSVLYKAKQRGAAEETVNANQIRLDAAKAEQESRRPVTATATIAEDGTITEVESAEVDPSMVDEL